MSSRIWLLIGVVLAGGSIALVGSAVSRAMDAISAAFERRTARRLPFRLGLTRHQADNRVMVADPARPRAQASYAKLETGQVWSGQVPCLAGTGLQRRRPPKSLPRSQPRPIASPTKHRAATWHALFEKFPVTVLVALQYGTLAVYPAIVHHTPLASLLIRVVLLALGVAFIVELAALFWRARPVSQASRLSPRSAGVVLAAGVVAQLGESLGGNAGYAAQIASQSQSHLAAIFTPFVSWVLFGTVMLMWLYRQGRLAKRHLVAGVGLALAIEVFGAYRAAFLGTLLVFGLTVLVIAVAMRLIRLRIIVVLFVVGVLGLPAAYNLRNDIRQKSSVPTGLAATSTVSNRVREDRNFAQISELPEVPINIGQPGPLTLLRFGLLPRALDRGRGSLDTASSLSVALGGQATSSATLTGLGSAYALGAGWRGVIEMVGLTAVAMAVAIRRRSAWGYAFAGLLVTDSLWIEVNWPDLIAALLQASVSLAVAAVFVRLCAGWRPRGRRPSPLSPARELRRAKSVDDSSAELRVGR